MADGLARAGKPRIFGHRNGVKNVRSVVNTAREMGVPYVTLYAFSTENQNRPDEEKSGLMRLLEEFLKLELASMLKDGIRLRAIGDLSGLPKFAQDIVEQTIEKTKHNSDWNLTLALNYGSRQEVLNGINSYAEKVLKSGKIPEQLNWSTFPLTWKPVNFRTPTLLSEHPENFDSVTSCCCKQHMLRFLYPLYTGRTLIVRLL